MNDRNNLFFDFINILSFVIGLENLSKNDEQIKALEEHLNKQDKQYEEILNLLKENANGK